MLPDYLLSSVMMSPFMQNDENLGLNVYSLQVLKIRQERRTNVMVRNFIYVLLSLVLIVTVPILVKAQENGERREIPTRFFANFIGTWQAPDSILAKFPPEMAARPLVTYEWGSQKRIVRLFEVHAPDQKEEGLLEGFVLWNPVTHKVEFYAYNKESDFLFRGEYTILEENRIQRIYDVYYPTDHRFYKGGNAVITFRETSSLSEDKKTKFNTVEYFNKRDGRWDPWSTSAMARKR